MMTKSEYSVPYCIVYGIRTKSMRISTEAELMGTGTEGPLDCDIAMQMKYMDSCHMREDRYKGIKLHNSIYLKAIDTNNKTSK